MHLREWPWVHFFEIEKAMKKLCYLICLLVILSITGVSAYAYNFNGNSLFNVDIPEGFTQADYTETSYVFTNSEGDSFNISFSANEDEFFVKDMSEKDIAAYKDDYSQDVATAMEAYELDIKSEFISCEKLKVADGTTALVSVIKTTIASDNRSETYYQKVYEFGGVNNSYTFSFSTTDEKRLNSLDNTFSSIVLNEASFRSTGEAIAVYSTAAIIALLFIAGIIRFVRTPEKRRQGKLK